MDLRDCTCRCRMLSEHGHSVAATPAGHASYPTEVSSALLCLLGRTLLSDRRYLKTGLAAGKLCIIQNNLASKW